MALTVKWMGDNTLVIKACEHEAVAKCSIQYNHSELAALVFWSEVSLHKSMVPSAVTLQTQ